jgi:two-component system, OmpR family, response regulator MprA
MRVLIVDDDAALRELMQWALRDEGFEVAIAVDGMEALERIAVAPPRLAVLDMTLPGVDGFGVAHALRARDIPILVVTADGNAAQKAARAGAYHFLRKPFAMAEFVASVREGLKRAQTPR